MALSIDGRLKLWQQGHDYRPTVFIVRFDDLSGLERSDYSNVTIHNLYRDATECIHLLNHNDLGVSDMLGFRPAC